MQLESENLNKIVCAKTVEIAKFKIKQKKRAKLTKSTHDQCVQTPLSYVQTKLELGQVLKKTKQLSKGLAEDCDRQSEWLEHIQSLEKQIEDFKQNQKVAHAPEQTEEK